MGRRTLIGPSHGRLPLPANPRADAHDPVLRAPLPPITRAMDRLFMRESTRDRHGSFAAHSHGGESVRRSARSPRGSVNDGPASPVFLDIVARGRRELHHELSRCSMADHQPRTRCVDGLRQPALRLDRPPRRRVRIPECRSESVRSRAPAHRGADDQTTRDSTHLRTRRFRNIDHRRTGFQSVGTGRLSGHCPRSQSAW